MRVVAALVVAIFAISAVIFLTKTDDGRWLWRAKFYQAQVLAQPDPGPGGLKHIVWNGWGMAGQETAEYLVYDPRGRLDHRRGDQPGAFDGLACAVWSVRALAPHWYLVTFYTDEDWNDCSR